MARDLADTRFSVLLADSTSVIVDQRVGQRSLNAALERGSPMTPRGLLPSA